MSDIAIRVQNLSKQYKIAAARRRQDTLRDHIVDGVKSLFRRNGQPDRGEETIWALKDVSFEVKQGEVVGIIGRNGAGKSTLLKILSRITEPTGGRADIYGRVGSLLEVGTGFDRELTGRENTYLNGAILGMKKAEIDRKFDEIVAFAEVEKFIDTPVKHYSSGMYVRLAFSVAAHLEPEILIVDEVLAVGDAAFQQKCLGKMGDVARQDRTVLFVSHNVAAITALCSTSLLLRDGRLLAQGETERIVMIYLKDLERPSQVPLADRCDRSGNGAVKYVDCTLSHSPLGPPISEFFVGDEMFVTVRLRASQRVKTWVGIVITDATGKKLMYTSTRLHGHLPFFLDGEDSLVLHIPYCALVEGRYSMKLIVFTAQPLELADSVENAAFFSMLPKDLYHSGFQVGSYLGVVHFPHHWLAGDGQPLPRSTVAEPTGGDDDPVSIANGNSEYDN